ncbi:hypothetical protein [Halorubrum cibi]|uniref:RNA polymerases M subunit n=1 Tax=Halorubrum cibi TaxID=413815 RepID=A0A521DMK2_9EURY|nr:hypothetical protein [Halorubrum cibi]SMO72832.1 RNA polymerases M subunit [Halorubrum cibi]
MYFCDDCGSMITPQNGSGQCENCGAEYEIQDGKSESFENEAEENLGVADGGESTKTKLESLPTTKSGSIPKSEAMDWLKDRDRPSGAEMKRAMMEKPSDFEGSTYPTDISNIRITGDPQFIETIAGLFRWVVDMEDYSRRVEINLKETEDRETGEKTGNYALYLSVAERG